MASPFVLAFFVTVALLGQTGDPAAGIVKIQAANLAAGTGFVVALPSGRGALIITAAHVVEGDDKPKVTFRANPNSEFTAKILDQQAAEERGFALLLVSNPPQEVRMLAPHPGFSKPQPGTSTSVIGYPAPNAVYSVKPSSVESWVGTDLLITPATGPGYSGGPVLVDGRVAGMIYGKAQDNGKAVPALSINTYLQEVEDSPIIWGPAPAPKTASNPQPRTEAPPPAPASALLKGRITDTSGNELQGNFLLKIKSEQTGDTLEKQVLSNFQIPVPAGSYTLQIVPPKEHRPCTVSGVVARDPTSSGTPPMAQAHPMNCGFRHGMGGEPQFRLMENLRLR